MSFLSLFAPPEHPSTQFTALHEQRGIFQRTDSTQQRFQDITAEWQQKSGEMIQKQFQKRQSQLDIPPKSFLRHSLSCVCAADRSSTPTTSTPQIFPLQEAESAKNDKNNNVPSRKLRTQVHITLSLEASRQQSAISIFPIR